METVRTSIRLPVSAEAAREAFWDLSKLGVLWERILDVRLLYQDRWHQEAMMAVERDGGREDIRIVRFTDGRDITFFNPVPPPMMELHRGAWTFREEAHGGTVIGAFREYRLHARRDEDPRDFAKRSEAFRSAFRERLDRILESARTLCDQNHEKTTAFRRAGP